MRNLREILAHCLYTFGRAVEAIAVKTHPFEDKVLVHSMLEEGFWIRE